MKLKIALVGTAACLLFCGPALAQATPDSGSTQPAHKKHHRMESVMERLDRMERVIEEQQSEIHDLKAQLNRGVASGGAASAGATAAATTPPPQPEVSAAQFEALQNQVYEMTAAEKPKDKKIHFKGVTVTLGGFAAAESVYRSREEFADIGSTYGGIPYGNSPQAHADEFRMTARQSRVSALVQGDVDPTTHLAFYGELDFLGAAASANSNESNSFQPRIRAVYGTVDWDDLGLEFLAGQNWSLATLTTSGMSPRTETPPPSIDAQYVPGFDWTRQPQLRLVKNFNDQVWLGISAENPSTTFGGTVPSVPGLLYNSGNGFNGGTGSGGPEFNPGITLSLNHIPDLIGKIAVEPAVFDGNVHLEAFGIYRDFYDRYGTLTNLSDVSTHDVSGGGGGAAALVKLVPGVFDIQADAMFGNGIGRYGSAQLPDVTFKPTGELAPLTEDMEMLGLTWHSTPALDVYLFGGREHEDSKSYDVGTSAYGWGNPLYVNTGCYSLEAGAASKCVGNTRQVYQLTPGFWWNAYAGDFGKFRVGLQYSYTQRDAFQGVGGSPKTYENMIFTSFRYYPF